MDICADTTQAATAVHGAPILSAEMVYAVPTERRARAVFDYALHARLSALGQRDGVLLLINAPDTLDALTPILSAFPHLRTAALLVNPAPLKDAPDTPRALGWPKPERWRALQTTDRWARVLAALAVAEAAGPEGFLAMPALDAVYDRPLLDWLEVQSAALGGAAVSPVTPFQHFPASGVSISLPIVQALNHAFNRDTGLKARLESSIGQGVWGKMSLIPRAACVDLAASLDTTIWEDDRELDRALRERSVLTRGLWVPDSALYHQSPPVFDRAGLKAVLNRTLHYSLHIPASVPAGTSFLLAGDLPRLTVEDSIFAHEARRLVDTLLAECLAEITARVERWGASWVDWGAYRCVARVGVPGVEVWQYLPP